MKIDLSRSSIINHHAPSYLSGRFILPNFLPVLTSLLLAQQQHMPIWNSQAIIANALAIHIQTNIVVPNVAPIFTSWLFANTFFMMTNMTVAMIDAAVMASALMKEMMLRMKAVQRLRTERGRRNMRTKERQAPVRKRPNITCEATFMMSRIWPTSSGSWTVTC